jgi:fucose permease
LSSVIFALGLFLTVAGVGMLSAAVAAYVWSMLSS